MTNLIVHDIDDNIVHVLQERAKRSGRSVEAEHRSILTQALLIPEKRTFSEVLAAVPDVGRDSDFERVQ